MNNNLYTSYLNDQQRNTLGRGFTPSTKEMLNNSSFNIQDLKIILENGQAVDLRSNYLNQINLFKQDQAYDYSWLRLVENKIIFATQAGSCLPLVYANNQTSRNSLVESSTGSLSSIYHRWISEIPSTNLGTSIVSSPNPIPNLISQPSSSIFNVEYLILDNSGSMYGGKIGGLKRGANDLVQGVPPGTQINLIPLNGSKITSDNKSIQELVQSVNSLNANGGTPLYSKIFEICSEVLIKAQQKEIEQVMYRFHIAIYTDGIASDHPNLPQAQDAYKTLMSLDSEGNPKYCVDLDFYAARGTGAEDTAKLIGIPLDRIRTFSDDETGVNQASQVMHQLRSQDATRMANATPANFRNLGRR